MTRPQGVPYLTIVATPSLQSAGRRAIDAYANMRRLAKNVSKELDGTSLCGVPITELDEEDSLVVVVKKALLAHER